MGKSLAKSEKCIRADGNEVTRCDGGDAISTGLIAPAVGNIPYIGWLKMAGWSALLGNQIGSEIGAEVGSVFNDC